MRAALLVLLAVTAAGCDDAPTGVSYSVSGTFTPDADDADAAALQDRLAPWDVTAQIMETYPMQYTVDGLDGPSCDEVRGMLETLDYIATVERCRAASA